MGNETSLEWGINVVKPSRTLYLVLFFYKHDRHIRVLEYKIISSHHYNGFCSNLSLSISEPLFFLFVLFVYIINFINRLFAKTGLLEPSVLVAAARSLPPTGWDGLENTSIIWRVSLATPAVGNSVPVKSLPYTKDVSFARLITWTESTLDQLLPTVNQNFDFIFSQSTIIGNGMEFQCQRPTRIWCNNYSRVERSSPFIQKNRRDTVCRRRADVGKALQSGQFLSLTVPFKEK